MQSFVLLLKNRILFNTIELLSSKNDSKPQAEATYEPMSMPTAGGGLQSDDIPF